MNKPALLLALLLSVTAVPVLAAGPRWNELNPGQQAILKSLQNSGDALPDQRRDRLAAGAQRWNEMDVEQRDRAQQRLERWKNMNPIQRARIQERRAEFRGLSPQERQRARARYEQLRLLPPAQRRRIRQRFLELSLRPGGIDQACPGTVQQRMDCLGLPRAPDGR